jgi:DNA-binding winged helix-turn-helix (wHTH) protein
VEEANLTPTIFTIRKVLGDRTKDRRYIASIGGRGYQFRGAGYGVHIDGRLERVLACRQPKESTPILRPAT